MVSVCCQGVVSGFECGFVSLVSGFGVLSGCCEWFWCGFVSLVSGFCCVVMVL